MSKSSFPDQTLTLEAGDFVRRADDGLLYRVEEIDGEDIFLDGGGCIGADQVAEVLLESEAYDEYHRQGR
jgi:hypothetical protein